MPLLDVFDGNAFGVVSLTESINKLPFKESRLGSLGLFASKGISTTTALVEEKDGKLALVPEAARGTRPTVHQSAKRNVRSFRVPHLPVIDRVLADDVQGVRAFGSETTLETVASKVNEKLEEMRADLEITHEFHRSGAIQGSILDADGTTEIVNLFTEFGITEQTANFDFTAGAEEANAWVTARKREVEDALGAAPITRIHAFAGDQWFDNFVSHADVKDAYARWRDGEFLRSDNRSGFQFAGVTFENYRGSLGSVEFIPNAEVRFVPIGVPRLFNAIMAPADYIETVNTIGRLIYAKQHRMDFDKGIEIEAQSNVLMMCNRPRCLVKGTGTNFPI